MRQVIWLLLSGLLITHRSLIAAAEKDFYEMSLEELLDVPVGVASKQATTQKRSPAIVTVITGEEIRSSGARDLIDVLKRVPGLHLATDVGGVVGLGVRGNWAHEAKVLLLIDGVEMNENLYGGIQLGNHYPVDHIRRIEIIRGPGSAYYGGQAEFAVIHVYTHRGEDLAGARFDLTVGQFEDYFSRRNFSAQYGTHSAGFEFTAKALVGSGQRSDRPYTDSAGDTYRMGGSSNLNPLHLNLGLTKSAFQARFLADHYSTSNRDGYGNNTPEPSPMSFRLYSLNLQNQFQLGPTLSVTPELQAKFIEPWRSVDSGASTSGMFYDRTSRRYTAKITGLWNLDENISLSAGVDAFQEEAVARSQTFSNGQNTLSFHNIAGFGEFTGRSPIIDWTVGARYNYHSAFDSNFVPRLSLGRSFGPVSTKLLYSRAFKAPTIENINRNSAIKPEETTFLEAEVSWQVSADMFLSLNAFDMRTTNPIAYFYNGADTYQNFGASATRGFEVEYRYKDKWGHLTTNYSYYARYGMTVPQYEVQGNTSQHLAFPNHKATANLAVKLGANWEINPSATYLGKRYGYTFDGTGISQKEFADQVHFDLFLNKSDLFVPGLDVGAGVFNLFGAETTFIQPYFNNTTVSVNHPVIPDAGREFLLHLRYRLSF